PTGPAAASQLRAASHPAAFVGPPSWLGPTTGSPTGPPPEPEPWSRSWAAASREGPATSGQPGPLRPRVSGWGASADPASESGASVVPPPGPPPLSTEPADPQPADPQPASPRPAARHLDRRHLLVLVLVVSIGMLGTGWLLLRARAVPVSGPQVVVSAGPTPTGPTPTGTGPASPGAPAPGAPAPPAASSTARTRVVVHVVGAVRRPGLVRLTAGSRVDDALRAAGGLTAAADPARLNLAQVVQDGQQIVIGTAGHPAGDVRGGADASGASAGSTASRGSTVDLNTATQAQLEELPGVGPVTATAILDRRAQHPFTRVEELQEVDGIGPKTYAQIAPHVRV
ncbi:MAG: comEA, partial [Friedmanniella sp.]|nr:comEA [Friedmanniella sp.]